MIAGTAAMMQLPPPDEGGGTTATERLYLGWREGAYRINGVASTVTALVETDPTPEWGTWDPDVAIVPGVGVVGLYSGPVSASLTSTALAAVVAGEEGLVGVFVATMPSPGAGSLEAHWRQHGNYSQDPYFLVDVDNLYCSVYDDTVDDFNGDTGAFPSGRRLLAFRFTRSTVTLLTDTGTTITATKPNTTDAALFDRFLFGQFSGDPNGVVFESAYFFGASVALTDALAFVSARTVPEGALFYANFAQGQYTTGVAAYDLADIIGADSDASAGWATTSLPTGARIASTGLDMSTGTMGFIGALKDALASTSNPGFILVLEWRTFPTVDFGTLFVAGGSDNEGIQIVQNPGSPNTITVKDYQSSNAMALDYGVVLSGTNRLAIRVTATDGQISVNGLSASNFASGFTFYGPYDLLWAAFPALSSTYIRKAWVYPPDFAGKTLEQMTAL